MKQARKHKSANKQENVSLCSFDCGWWLVLICYERTVFLTGWQLVAGTDLV